MKKKKLNINKWDENNSNSYITYDLKIFTFDFARLTGQIESNKLSNFVIKRQSYYTKLDIITRYIDFFIQNYDTDNELPYVYLTMKYHIDVNKEYERNDIPSFVQLLMSTMFDNTNIAENIKRMVDDQYTYDVENHDNKTVIQENDYVESLEWSNEHAKGLLMISVAVKLLVPIVFHYITLISAYRKINYKTDKILYEFYKPLFEIFNHSGNLHNKLYVNVKSKITEAYNIHRVIFEQREITGSDVTLVIDSFFKINMIGDNLFKLIINENILGFIKTIIKKQIGYFTKEENDKTLTEISLTPTSDGLSGLDKLDMNLPKINEGLVFVGKISIGTGIDILKRNNTGITISDAEMEFYNKHYKQDNTQKNLVYMYFSKFFGEYDYLDMSTRSQNIYLTLLLYKKLMINFGCSNIDEENLFCVLPFILTGNFITKTDNTKIIRNNNLRQLILKSKKYEDLKRKYSNIISTKLYSDYILRFIESICNTQYSFCVYDRPELNGVIINYDDNVLINEILLFLNML